MSNCVLFLSILTTVIFCAENLCCWPAQAQDPTGTSLGIPNSSPGVFWPRGMSLEALSPANLYPNGAQFGLSNTSGGFGMSGSGPISGVGLEQRTVSILVRDELQRPYLQERRLLEVFSRESAKSSSLFGVVLGNRFRYEMQVAVDRGYSRSNAGILISPYLLPSVDAVLNDLPASTESILRTGL